MPDKNKKLADSAQTSVRFSFLVSLSDIALNLLASIITGSVVLFSQALQGLSDAISSALVFFGYRHSRHRADKGHPLGYGREIFFWVLIASIITAGVTGSFSILRGIDQLNTQPELTSIFVAVIVLCIGLFMNAYSVKTSMLSLLERRNPFKKVTDLFGSSFVETKISLLIDSLGTMSAFVGLFSILLYIVTGNTAFDAYGAITIGCITVLGAMSLIFDVYGLIIGKSADQATKDKIKENILEVDGVEKIEHLKVVVIGSGALLVIAAIRYDRTLTLVQREHRTVKARAQIKKLPSVRHVVIESL